ncbi:MAG: DUF4214 domain-containing protein [Sulfuricurvum sp.]
MVFGNDDRLLISSSQLDFYSYAPAVQIFARFSDGYIAQGSGTMVGKNDVLTAAHVLFSAGHGGYAVAVEVTPLRVGELKPFGVVYGTDMIVSNSWAATGSYDGDYGLITLARPIGYQSGWVDIGSVNGYELLNQEVQSYGYPGDLANGNSLYKISGSVDGSTAHLITFSDDLDARGGQSGSGIFTTAPDGVKIVGVISHESLTPDYNAAVTFNSVIAAQIQGWIAANDADVPKQLDAPLQLRPVIEEMNFMVLAFLGRNGTKTELDILSDAYAGGSDTKAIAQMIYHSDAYASTAAATMNNSAFLTHVFTNVLNLSYSIEEFSYWLGALDSGMPRSDGLLLCATLDIFRASHKLDVYETWHRSYRDFSVEAVASDENTTLIAREEDSLLRGGEGNDTLIGNNGADYLYGMGGNDSLTGGGGADFFAWDTGMGIDRILDFTLGEDTLRLRSHFDWSWGTDTAGNLSLIPDQGSGAVILIGISLANASFIPVLQG